MWSKVKFIILTLLPWIVAVDRDKHRFLGGTISYTTTPDSNGQYKADVELLTGWVLGTGPCGPGCNSSRLGTSTFTTRKQIETSTSEPYFFGRFFLDSDEHCEGSGCIDNTIKSTMTEKVFALNEEAKWEQAIARFSISYNDTLDVNFDGDFWRYLSLTNSSLKWHLQAKLSSKTRNDTQKPNCLPEVLGRPYYRVKLNETTTIKMAVSDADGDALKCVQAEFVEGGAISYHKATGVDVLENCQVKITTNISHGYKDDTWIAVAVVVRDYNEKTIMYGGEKINPYAYSLGYTNFQFAVNVLEKLSPPQFVSPTPPNGHKFVLYIGVLWTTEIYAEASENATIASFTRTSRRIQCGMSDMKDDPKRERVKHVTLTWRPLVNTIGTQTICITAQDDTGVDSAEDTCVLLHVMADKFNHSHNAPSAGKPVFIDIPAPEQIINCPIHTTCFVPLYIKSAFNVTSVHIERYYTYDAKVGSVVKLPMLGNDIYKTDLSFRDTSHGEKQLCFIATNSNGEQSDKTCIMSEIEPANPCVSNPCRNSGTCSLDKRSGTFTCSCIPNFFGKRCENKTLLNPCLNGGLYSSTGVCYCLSGFTGTHCETDINFCTTNATCSQHGICKDGTINYTCECIDRFTGSECQKDNCPEQGADKASCPVAGCENIDCNDNGLCTEGGVCKCSSGYTGSQCETVKGSMSSLNSAEVAFVPPTLQAGSTLVCHIEGNLVHPCAVDAFVITRSGDKPIVDRRLSPELDVNSITKRVALSQDVRGVTGMYYATIIIKGIVASTEGHFACIIASHGTSKVERCYQIKLVQDPRKDPTSLQYAQKNASMNFIDPTPKDGSVILCSKNVSCHLMLYTHSIDHSSACHDMISTTKDVLVFKAHQERQVGPCVAEVSFLFNGNVDREICFQSSLMNYQQRCFQIRLYEPNSDPCDSTSCYNGGHCIRTSQDDFTCECPPNFIGDKCQKGPCQPGENICQNNAYCQKSENSVSCICRLGFTGSHCDKDSGNSTLAPTALFTDTAKPDIFQCVIDQNCSVSLILSSTFPANERLTVAFGYRSPVVDVIQLKTSNLHTNNTELLQTSLILKGRQEGLYRICLQIQNSLGTVTDEMCFKVNVITDVTSINAWLDRPYFVEPSLPTHTTVECAENSVCHVLYQVTSGKGNNDKCISIRPTVSEGSLNFHLFTTCDRCMMGVNETGNCNIDVSFTTPPANGQKITMCLELSIRSTTTIGEERCFNLAILKTADAHAGKGCQLLQCTNGGFCDGRDADHPFCICPKGFAGTSCKKDATTVDPSEISSSNFIGDSAMPGEINCKVRDLCSVPYQVVHKPGENTTLELGYTDGRIFVVAKQFNANSSTGSITFIPQNTGTFKLCQQIMLASLTADEICTTLNVQGVAETVDKNRPYFVLPTLTSESTVMCHVKKSCHLEIHFSKFNDSKPNEICPDVVIREETTVDKMHMFDVLSTTSNNCIKDVSVIHNTEDVRRLCLQLVLPGKKGEIRCFNIHFVNDIFSEVQHPCRGFKCMNFGKCLAIFRTSTPTASCICQNGFSGDNCQNVVGGNDTLPGVEGITTETASQYFDTLSALPTLVQCKGTEPCCIAVPYYGNKNLPPLIGFQDNGLRVENESVYTPLNTNSRWHVVTRCFTGTPGQTNGVCYQTTTDGTNKSINVDEMCFEVGFKSSGTQPSPKSYNIVDPPDGTRFACLPNKVCHILVRTEMKSGHCEQVKQCGQGMPGAHIFRYTLSDGICSANISIAIGDDGTTDTMCISSGGDERNLIVESKSPSSMGYGPCQKLHCLHGGVCKAQTKFQAVCECPGNYSGVTCEKENVLCNNFVCLNGGSCKKTNGTQPVCECPATYTGLQCDTAQISHFDDRFAVPKVVSCNDQEPCCVSLAYKGSPNYPPVVSGYDMDINITSGPNISDTGMGYTGVYVTRTCVEASVGIQHKLCLKTSSQVVDSMKQEETCFLIDVHHKVSQSTSIQPQFVRSLPDGTRVLCKPNASCHLPVITTAVNGTCERVKSCGGNVMVVSPVNENGLCKSTVIWVTGATSHDSSVCITAGNGGEKRHFVAEIVELNFTDHSPCMSQICNHGGKCVLDQTSPPQKAVCVCMTGYVGTTCETDAKPTVLPGVDNVLSGVDVSQHFVGNAAVPTDVQCDSVNNCCLSVPYNGVASLPPILAHHDSSLTVTSGPSSIPSTPGSSDSHISVTCINGTIGPHKLCLQTTTNGTRDGMNIDEICVNIHVNTGGHNTTKNGPHFDGSTLTNGTHVVCMPTSECHLPVITAKHNGSCPQVDLCEPVARRIHVFDTTPVGDKCITDVAMKTGAAETMPVCISAGLSGEEHHLLFETKDTSNTGFGSCQKLHCKNGGSCDHEALSDNAVCQCLLGFLGNDCDHHVCDSITCMNDGKCIVDDTGSSMKGVCMCPSGFSGDECNTPETNNSMIPGVKNMPNHTTVQQYFDGNNAIPKGIVCDAKHECCVPVQYTGEAFLPPILGYHDTDLAIVSGPRTVVSNGGTHMAVTCVKGTPGKTQRFCLQTTTDGTNHGMNVDEICVEVDTQSGGVLNTLEPHFAGSLPNGTHVVCKPDSQCHIPVVTSTNTNSCDQVSSCGTNGDGTHVFPTKLVNGSCITDVAIKTGSAGSTKHEACISAGPNGEQHVLLVDIKDPSADGFGGPCQKLHCRNGGSCKSTTDKTATCDCPVGYDGQDCGHKVCENVVCNNGGRCVVNTKGSTIQGVCLCTGGFSGTNCDARDSQTLMIPGVQRLPPNVTTQQIFLGNNAVPKDMHCDDNRNCCFPIQYTGDKDRPPILGHHDNDLVILSGPQTVVSNAGTHVAVTCVKGVAGRTQRLCLQTTTNGTKQGMNVDEICVKIETRSGGTSAPMEYNFANSLPNGTSVVCKADSQCHIPVITIAKANTCDQVNNCGTARDRVHPFTTKLVNGTCITDVAVITGPAGSTEALCLSSGSSGSTLQLQIDVKNLTDGFGGPCQKLHCRSGGSCLATNESFATCNCPVGYTGKECSHTPCNETACANSGLCVADNVHLNGICICTSDFSGPNCEKAVDKTVAFPGTKNLPSSIKPTQQFIVGSAVPKVVTCDGINPCCISIPYYGDKDLPPIVGHKTTDIISGPVSITPDSTKPDSHIATTCVKGHPGEHDRLCLQTTSNGTEGGINVDEICVNVRVQSGAQKPPVSTEQPHFTTSLPNGSTVVCQPNSVCHIPVTTAQIAGTCWKVTSCNANDRSLHVINTKPVDDKCVSDVAVTTGADGTRAQLCISAGSSGEQRTLTVETKDVASSGFGPCGRKHCLNGGRCKSYTSVGAVCACPAQFTGDDCRSPVQLNTACPSVPCKNGGLCIVDSNSARNMKCVCALGFAGRMCDKVEEQLPLPTVTGTTTDNPARTAYSQMNPAPSYSTGTQPYHHYISQTFFNNTALPQHIQCAPEKPCCLQVPYHGDKDLPPMFGFHDEDLTVLQDPDVVTIGSGSDSKSHVAEICVKGQPGKVHRLCLQTTTNGTVHGVNLDEICVEIELKSPVSTTQHQQVAPGPHFKNSLPDGTELICKPNTMCHVPVTTETTDGICEQVTTCVPGQVGVHAFLTQKANDKCITDVVVKAGDNGHLTNICLSVGSEGENLNLAMKATHDNAFGPCRELHCQNAGMCLSVKSGSPAICKCLPDFTGMECETGPQCSKEGPQCSKEDVEHVKTMVVSGHASCSCIVNGKKVNIVKKRPVAKKEKLYSAAGFGAGGMAGSMAVGVVIYIIVNKLKRPPKSFQPRSPGSKVHPTVDVKRKEANMKNISF